MSGISGVGPQGPQWDLPKGGMTPKEVKQKIIAIEQAVLLNQISAGEGYRQMTELVVLVANDPDLQNNQELKTLVDVAWFASQKGLIEILSNDIDNIMKSNLPFEKKLQLLYAISDEIASCKLDDKALLSKL